MSKSLKVLLLMDEAWVPRNDPELRDQAAEPLTERHVAGALRELGHEAAVLGVGEDVAAIVAGSSASAGLPSTHSRASGPSPMVGKEAMRRRPQPIGIRVMSSTG